MNLKILFLVINLLTLLIQDGSAALSICSPMGLYGFCLLTRQFKEIVKPVTPPIYPQFKELIELLPDNPYAAYTHTKFPHKPGIVETSIYSYQQICELDYIIGDFGGTGAGKAIKGGRNPYKLEVTEIHVNGGRLHNWLHLKISVDKSRLSGSGAIGKVKMGFLIVHDANSHPVGDFNHQLPCGFDCNCKYFKDPLKPEKCLQANLNHHIPCMFTNDKVVTHPGQMMFYDENGVEEIHATWHFAQHQNANLFVTELHFRALLVESFDKTITIDPNIDKVGKEIPIRTGMFGWNPMYTILRPTIKSVGGWDYFRRHVYEPKQIECHKPVSKEFYIERQYPSYGTATPTERIPELTGKENNIVGSRHYDYAAKDSGKVYDPFADQKPRDAQLYWGKGNNLRDLPYISVNTHYRDQIADRKVVDTPLKTLLNRLIPISPKLLEADRCTCPMIPSTPKPQDLPPPNVQIQGRKAHALQMIIAWLMLIPFGIFSSRYFKETYSKVFFLQEYWWYSIHVLCMLAAAMFMFGGIYAMEIKRIEPIRWGDNSLRIHVIFGGSAMAMFVCQIPIGFFRLRHLEMRITQIFLHWFFGNLEYVFAVVAIFASSNIISGCMPCGAVGYLIFWIVVQICFFVGMELHMRDIDKQLKLIPPRSYLPPPVMRLFHDNAPQSKFRVHMLILYAFLCTLSFAIIHMLIKYNDDGVSCFNRIKKAEEI